MTSLAPPVPLALCRPVEEVRNGAGLSLEAKFGGWCCQVLTGAGRLWSPEGEQRDPTAGAATASPTAVPPMPIAPPRPEAAPEPPAGVAPAPRDTGMRRPTGRLNVLPPI